MVFETMVNHGVIIIEHAKSWSTGMIWVFNSAETIAYHGKSLYIPLYAVKCNYTMNIFSAGYIINDSFMKIIIAPFCLL